MLEVVYTFEWWWSLWRLDEGLRRCMPLNLGGVRCVLSSSAYMLAIDAFGTCESIAMVEWGVSERWRLVIAWYCGCDCWKLELQRHCTHDVMHVEHVYFENVGRCFNLLVGIDSKLWAKVVSLSSTFSTSSLMVLLKNLSVKCSEDAALLCIIWVLISRTGACAKRMAIWFGAVSSMLLLCGMKSIFLPRM